MIFEPISSSEIEKANYAKFMRALRDFLHFSEEDNEHVHFIFFIF